MFICEPNQGALLHSRGVAEALDHVEDAIVVFSVDRAVRYSNRSAGEIFGREGRIEVPLPEPAWEQIDGGRRWSGYIELRQDVGMFRLRVEAHHADGLGVLVVAHDVTEVERLRSIADSVNLSDNLGHFVSGIRHELGNPVNSIKTALTVLRSNLQSFSADKVTDYLDRVLGEVGRIEYLLFSLRSISRHESLALGQVDVSECIRKVVALARPNALESKVRLTFEPSASSVLIVVDVRALCQILLNLISNAIEAEPGPHEPMIGIELSVHEDSVDIAVVDNGRGMSPDELALAMRPFHTTKRSGTGLGLVIAQRLASNQGGRLRMSSELGRGTRAVVSLPRAPTHQRPT